jgi:hypothetical protein
MKKDRLLYILESVWGILFTCLFIIAIWWIFDGTSFPGKFFVSDCILLILFGFLVEARKKELGV